MNTESEIRERAATLAVALKALFPHSSWLVDIYIDSLVEVTLRRLHEPPATP